MIQQIGRKIYYEILTRNIIVEISERAGFVRETTTEEDFSNYTELYERVPANVGCLQLDYGQYAEDFARCNGYRLNESRDGLEFSYPDPEAPESPPVYRKPLSQEVEELKAQNAAIIKSLVLADIL